MSIDVDVDLDVTTIRNERLQGFDVGTVRSGQVVAIRSRFTECRFENFPRTEFIFGGGRDVTYYEGCSFDRSVITSETSGNGRFIGCTFTDVTMELCLFNACEFVDCTFSGRLTNVSFWASLDSWYQKVLGRRRNEFTGNDFRGARLKHVAFKGGIDLRDQTFSLGPDLLLVESIKRDLPVLRREVATWDESPSKTALLQRFDMVEWDLTPTGQEQDGRARMVSSRDKQDTGGLVRAAHV
jgi:hypothetical protein